MFSFFAPQLLTYLRFRNSFYHLARGVPSPYTNPKLTKSLSYALGTSGTIHACLTLAALSHPSAPIPLPAGLMLHLPDAVPTPSRGTAWAAVCAVESICMCFMLGNVGWAANLCGVVFGVAYTVFGPSLWVSVRAALHRVQFPDAWEVKVENGVVDRCPPYPGKYLADAHPLFKRSFGDGVG
ncbi:hypothetical protein H0H92_010142 [Tricholoma furcatifolium]|nr:hypothetical protein H0H92_010142 [Tricholoma furcatifolium]